MGLLVATSIYSCNIQQFRARIQRLDNSLGARSWSSADGVRLVFGEYPFVRWVYESIRESDHAPMGMLKWADDLEQEEYQKLTQNRLPTRASWIVLPWSSTSMRPWYDPQKGVYRAGIEAYEESNNRVQVDFLDGYSPEDPKKDYPPIGRPFEEFTEMLTRHLSSELNQIETASGSESMTAYSPSVTYLFELLRDRFSEDELKTLCFYLQVDHENLPAKGKEGVARELIRYFERRQQLQRIVEIGEQLRPDMKWPAI